MYLARIPVRIREDQYLSISEAPAALARVAAMWAANQIEGGLARIRLDLSLGVGVVPVTRRVNVNVPNATARVLRSTALSASDIIRWAIDNCPKLAPFFEEPDP